MHILRIVLRILLCLLLLLPVLGTLGVFPPPTEDMYTPEGWVFFSALLTSGYLLPLLGATFLVCLILTILNRTALAAILLAPLTVNIVFFHAMLDSGLFSASAIMGNVLLVLNLFFLWDGRMQYRELWKSRAAV